MKFEEGPYYILLISHNDIHILRQISTSHIILTFPSLILLSTFKQIKNIKSSLLFLHLHLVLDPRTDIIQQVIHLYLILIDLQQQIHISV